MDKQIIEGLNIYAKYKVDDDRIEFEDDEIILFFIGFSDEDALRLKELGRRRCKQGITDFYYYKV